jgi:hypothetical protein
MTRGREERPDLPEAPALLGAQVDRDGDDEPHVARGEQEDASGREDVHRAVVGEHAAELRLGVRAAELAAHEGQHDDERRRDEGHEDAEGGVEAGDRQQQAAREEPDALQRTSSRIAPSVTVSAQYAPVTTT